MIFGGQSYTGVLGQKVVENEFFILWEVGALSFSDFFQEDTAA